MHLLIILLLFIFKQFIISIYDSPIGKPLLIPLILNTYLFLYISHLVNLFVDGVGVRPYHLIACSLRSRIAYNHFEGIQGALSHSPEVQGVGA